MRRVPVPCRVFMIPTLSRISAALTVNVDFSPVKKMLESAAFQSFMEQYNIALTVFLGLATILVIVILFFNITKLSASADNDYKRREAINGILVCLVCTAIMGGIDVVYGILLSFVFNF